MGREEVDIMENTPSSTPTPASLRLSVFSFALASALTTLILGLIAWPLHGMMRAHAAARQGMYGSGWHGMAGPHAPVVMHQGMGGPWHLLALIIVMVWAGVGAAILAALYNAFVGRR